MAHVKNNFSSSRCPPIWVALAHEGTKAYSNAFELVHRREANGPNAIWQADHTPLDILLIRPDGAAAKPWLTTVIDDYSRAVAGYFLSFEDPSALHTSLASNAGWGFLLRESEFPATLYIMPRVKSRRWSNAQASVTVCLSLLIHFAAMAQTTPPTYDFVKNGVQSANVDNSTGVPRLMINGQPVPPLLFFFTNSTPSRMQYLAPQMQDANAAGIHIFSMGFDSWPWDPASATFRPDYSAANAEMDQFLAIDPRAVFLLRIPSLPPPSWSGWATYTQWGKNEDILYSDGTTTLDSIASNVYLQGFLSGVTNMIQHYEGSSYAPHILGYHITGQDSGQWFPNQYRQKGLDYSPVNTTAFRSWLQQKYVTDAALSTAWGRTVTIISAPLPIPAPERFPMHGASQGDPVQEFYTLPSQQDWVDYSDYTSDIFSSVILTMAHTVRTATGGKRLVAVWNGDIYNLPGSMNAQARMDRLLASPDIDIFANDVSYITLQERLAGGAGGPQYALDSVALHGKLWMTEDDLRTYLSANLPDLGYNGNLPTSDFFETSNVLQRNLASMIEHRAGTWWMDLNATGAFNSPDLWTTVMGGYGLPLYNELYANPTPLRPEVAVITDDRSVLYQASDWDLMVIPRTQLSNAIAKVGASIGYYDLRDFLSGGLPRAKVYIFVNSFYLTDGQIATIRSRLQAEGATAIWQYAPGYIGPNGPDVARCSTLTGIQLSVSSGYSGSTGTSLLGGHVWGWAWQTPWIVLTPRFVVTDQNATILGRYWSDNAASTASKQSNGFTSVFVGDVGWTTDMLVPLLSAAGVHIWTTGNDVIHTDGSYFVVHAGTAGQQNISLPAGVTATPLGGGAPTSNPQPLQTSFSRIGETQWFRLAKTPSTTAPALQPWTGVVNGASLQGGAISPGGWITLFGSNLAPDTRIWTGSDFVNGELPTQLDGVSITVSGVPAYVYYISPTQINALLPANLTGNTVQVSVTTPQGRSDAIAVALAPVAPAFFTFGPDGGKYAAAVFADGSYVGPPGLFGDALVTRAAKPGDTIQLFTTGLGATSPPAPDGVVLTSTYSIKPTPVVTLGGVNASVTFAGLVSPGLYQVNVVVPNVSNSDAALVLKASGAASQTGVFVAISN